eukprot:GHVR01133747.1.p3 GENE.GHVR01133747.1~~GHVR01133747.1.p3  ORF type:complete len:101 (+),score=49.54 GHVR01133747.1:200-502(+)
MWWWCGVVHFVGDKVWCGGGGLVLCGVVCWCFVVCWCGVVVVVCVCGGDGGLVWCGSFCWGQGVVVVWWYVVWWCCGMWCSGVMWYGGGVVMVWCGLVVV